MIMLTKRKKDSSMTMSEVTAMLNTMVEFCISNLVQGAQTTYETLEKDVDALVEAIKKHFDI